MQIILPDNHPSIMHSYDVDNLLRSHFPGSPLTLFNFGKVHQDGSVSFITNNAELSKTFLKANVRKAHSSKSPELLDKHNYWHLWEHHLLDFPFDFFDKRKPGLLMILNAIKSIYHRRHRIRIKRPCS